MRTPQELTNYIIDAEGQLAYKSPISEKPFRIWALGEYGFIHGVRDWAEKKFKEEGTKVFYL